MRVQPWKKEGTFLPVEGRSSPAFWPFLPVLLRTNRMMDTTFWKAKSQESHLTLDLPLYAIQVQIFLNFYGKITSL